MSQFYNAVIHRLTAILAICLLMLSGGVTGQTVVVTNPSSPWTVPANVASLKIEVWGGGGGGGSANRGGLFSGYPPGYGGGGGGGAYNSITLGPGSIPSALTIQIGNGGAGGSSDNGNSGGVTRVLSGTTLLVSANGGLGGGRGNGAIGSGGNGGTGGLFNGGNGGGGSTNGNGGGGGAGNAGIGSSGTNTNGGAGGSGNPNVIPYRGGNGGAHQPNSANGSTGFAPGGGGGGAKATNSTARTGGAGGQGQVVITYTIDLSPTITNFTATSACLGSTPTVTLTGTNFTGATAVRFNGVNASSFTVVNATTITAVLPAAGVSTGPVSVITPDGTGTSSNNFTINTAPSITGQPSGAGQTRCVGVAANALSVNATGTGLSYQWYRNTTADNSGGTPVGTNSNTYTPVTTAVSEYYYYVVVSGTCSPAVTSNISGLIKVNPLPVAGAITGDAGVCVGANTTLVANPSGTGTFTYTWASSNTAVATVNNAGVVTGVGEGTTNITYTVTDGNGCSATSANYTFRVSPSAGAITTTGNVTGACAGGTVQMIPHAGGVSPFTYDWQSSNPAVATVSSTGMVTAVSLGTTNISYTVTDANGCTAVSPAFAFSVTQPTAGNITGPAQVCAGSAITLLSHGAGTGTLSYTWASSDNSVATVNNSGVVTGVSAGSAEITYTVKDGNGCTMTSAPYNITVNPRPATATGATGGATCGQGSVTLSVADPGAGYTIDWYAASGGTALATGTNSFTTPNITATANYFAEVRNTATGCASANRLSVTATYNALPAQPGTGAGAATCGPGIVTISAPAASGTTIDWYDAPTNGNLLLSGSNTFTTPVISLTTTYYAAARNTTTGCVSALRREVVATVNAVPAAPNSTGNARCGAGQISLSVTPVSGVVFDWFTESSGGSVLSTGNTYSPNISSTTTYYVQSRVSATGCTSAIRTPVTATINPLPSAATGAVHGSRCVPGTITLSVDDPGAGFTVDWYSAATGGTVLAGGSGTTSFTTPNYTSANTVSYYAQVRNVATGCVSPARLQVTATFYALPGLPAGTSASRCGPGVVNISASSTGAVIDWYDAPSGGNLLLSGSNNYAPDITSTTIYYAEARNATTGCTSSGRRAVTATINTVPPPPVPTSSNGTLVDGVYYRCESVAITATGGSGYNVYYQGTNPNGTSTAAATQTITASGTYFYRSRFTSAGNCWSEAVPITVVVHPAPATPVVSGAGDFCGSTVITATGGTGGTIYFQGKTSNGMSTADPGGTQTVTSSGTYYFRSLSPEGCWSTQGSVAVTIRAVPTGSLGVTEASGMPNNHEICAGASVTFTAPNNYSFYTFKINEVVKQAGTTRTFSTTELKEGDVVTVDILNDLECGTTLTAQAVTVIPVPENIVLTATEGGTASDGVICKNDSVVFSVPGGYANYNFKINNVTAYSGPLNTFTTSTLANNNTVKVEVSNTQGCMVVSNELTFTVNALPAGNLTAPKTTICAGDSLTITAPDGFTNYVFKVNDEIVAGHDGTRFFTSAALVSPSVITAEVSNASGCTATLGPLVITVNPLPSGTLSATESSGTANDHIICANAPVRFTATSGFSSYQFFIDGVSQITQSTNVWNTTAIHENAVVTVRVRNAQNCYADFNPVGITVIPAPDATLSISTPTTICAGTEVTFTAPAGAGNTYRFLIGTTAVQTGPENVFTTTALQNGQVVKVEVSNSNDCKTVSNAFTMTVNPLPSGTMDISETSGLANNDGIICAGDAITFTAPAGYQGYDFLVNGVSVQSGSSNIFTTSTLTNGNAVTVVATSNAGCASVLNTQTITVNPLPAVSPITGDKEVCAGSTTQLINTAGGTWTSKDETIATVDAGTGMVTGVRAGTAIIVYTTAPNASGCTNATEITVTVHALPVVNAITGTLRVCAGGTTALSNTTIGGTWSSSDAAVATINAAGEVTGIAEGTVTITYTVTNSEGCVNTATAEFVVNPLPVVPVIEGKPQICVNETTTFTNALGGGAWTSSNPSVATIVASNGQLKGLSPGVSTISYTVTDTNGCSATVEYDITVNALPLPGLDGPNPICPGTTETYTTDPEQFNYVWTINGGVIVSGGTSADNTVTITWGNSGTKSVYVNYENASGCAGATSVTIDNGFISAPEFDGPLTVCLNSAGNVYTTLPGKENYSWEVNGGTITNGAGTETITVTWNETGTGSIILNYAEPGGCNAATPAKKNITVRPLPNGAVSGSRDVCEGSTPPEVTFTGSGGTAPYTFTYTLNGGSPQTVTTTGNTAKITTPTSTSGTFVYELISVKDGNAVSCENAATGTVTINVTAQPSATIAYAGPYCTSEEGPVSVTRTGTPGGTYSAPSGLSIDPADGTITPSSSTPGTYTVTYTVAAAGGCFVYSTTTSVTITAAPSATISYNGGPFCSSSGVVSVTHTGSTGGQYTALPAGLMIDMNTGAITPSSSSPGTYTVTYTVAAAGGCGEFTTTTTVVISQAPNASIAYNASPYCTSGGTANVSLTGTSGGTFTASPSGLSINAGTGAINLGSSTAGTYTVTFTIGAGDGCPAFSTNTAVVITPAPVVNAGSSAVPTCENSGAVNITSGSSASNYSSLQWTSGGTGSFANQGSLTATTYTPSAADISAGSVTLTLTAIGQAGCGSVSSSKTLTINAVPDAFIIEPASANLCEGDVQVLSASGSASISDTRTFNSSSANNNLSIPNPGNRTSTIPVSGIPAGATITYVDVHFNVSHEYTGELVLNLRAPNGNVLNLVNQKGGSSGNGFNTTIRSTATNNISGNAPFNGTYRADRVMNVGAPIASNVNTFNQLLGTMNGNWVLSAQDIIGCRSSIFGICIGGNYDGRINNWSITIHYEVAATPLSVTWSPANHLYTDIETTIPYTGQNLSKVYAKPDPGTMTYTATQTNAAGCSTTKTVNVVTNAAPVVSITANYCAVPGFVTLTATSVPAAASYRWSNGATTQTIQVDESGTYEVQAMVAGSGCPGEASISVSNELVINGDFENGDTDFHSDYNPRTGSFYTGSNTSGLWPEGTYAVDTSAFSPRSGVGYHSNFHGRDHTTGNGKFLMVNGSRNVRTIWEQTVNILPNTDYYFSAWAMNLNPDEPARLQFEINGELAGSIADLRDAPKPTSESAVGLSNWVRFYSNPVWRSGPATTVATIRIINLNTDAGGNDFGLDDISFGTLSTFIQLVSAPGTDAQTLCKNSPVENIIYNVGNGSDIGPVVTGLPDGVTSVFNGDRLIISGTPTVAGNYTYTVTTTGCGTMTATGTIAVEEQKIDLTSGSNAPVCRDMPMPQLVYTLSGKATGATVTGLPAGVTGTVEGNLFTISGNPAEVGEFPYIITTSGDCEPVTISGTLTVAEQTIELTRGPEEQTLCINTAMQALVYTIGGTGNNAVVTGLPAGVTAKVISGILTITGTPSVAGSHTFTVTTSGTCNPVVVQGTIHVTPNATISLSSAAGTDDQTVCDGGSLTDITYHVVDATGAEISGGSLPAGVTVAYNEGVFTLSGTPSESGIFPYTITTTGGCTDASVSGSITVNAQTIELNLGTSSPSVCANANMPVIVYKIGGEATGAAVDGLPEGITFAVSGNLVTISGIPTAAAGVYPYTITTEGDNCQPVSLTGTITVQPEVVPGTIASISVCSGANGTLTLLGNTGTVKRWERSVDYGVTWTPIANTSVSLAFTNILTTTWFRAVVGNNCGDLTSTVSVVGVRNLWTGAVDTDWHNGGNWSDGQVPDITCPNVYIPNTTNKPILSAGSSAIRNIYIDAGAALTINGTGSLHIAGNIYNSGTFDASEGEIVLNGTVAQNIGTGTFENNAVKDFKVSNNTGVNVNDTLDIYGSLTFGSASGRINTNGYLTLKSNINNTAWVGNMTESQVISGEVTVERFINTGTSENPDAHRKSWQLLAVPTDGSQTINHSWQEGATYPNENRKTGYGTMIVSNAGGNQANAVALGFDQYTAPGPSIKVWNATTEGYDGPPNTLHTPIYNIHGWMVMVRGDRSVITSNGAAVPTTLRSKGTLFTPAKKPLSVPVSPGQTVSVGNPYASAIDLRQVNFNGLSEVVTVWDPRAQGSYSLGAFVTLTRNGNGNYYPTPASVSYPGTETAYNIIESGQAFFIQAQPAESGSISFTENAKVSGSNPVLLRGGAESPLKATQLRTNLLAGAGTNTTLADGNLIQFDATYSNQLDHKDARKLANSSENWGIASNNQILSVERRMPVTAADTIFFRMSGMRTQTYTLELLPLGMEAFGVEGFLEDNYLGTRTPVNMEGTTLYEFKVENKAASYAANRFRIVFHTVKAAPLPVTFLGLQARQVEDDILVNWKVENEQQMTAYEVEKSADGVRFGSVASIAALNNGSGTYDWIDRQAGPGWHYYRIRSVDAGGMVRYSDIVKVMIEAAQPKITVYPNPIVNGIIHVHLINQPEGNYRLRLLNAAGQTMVTKQITRQKGTSIEPLTWDYKLARGNYRIEITKPDGSVNVITVMY